MWQSCFVPNCKNTSDTLPKKIFVTVPKDKHRRQQWYEAIGRPYVSCAHKVCCEDHFNLESDAKNWMYYKTVGSRLCLKEDVVPHKFVGCEPLAKGDSQISPPVKRRKRNNADKLESTTVINQSLVEDPPPLTPLLTSTTEKVSIIENSCSVDEYSEHFIVTESIPGVCVYMSKLGGSSEQIQW
ncbi:uncharacterized protein LOC124155501 [Ischnura elegans]|uniref:uncharacterized protein LOC124155501 n=1 Tax=Ischnura elegans TaxID=197161 RepID=UPI001ED88C5E|nr:uncharacterized protein LOC124155501 [Ischnura elegans]